MIENICKKCPLGGLCYEGILKVLPGTNKILGIIKIILGYWRMDNISDNIVLCEPLVESCL